MSIRLYFDLEAFQALISESTMASILNIESFKVYESSSKDGNFVHVKTVDYDPTKDFLEIPALVAGSITSMGTVVMATIAGYSNCLDWFKLSYLAGYSAPISVVAEVVPVSALSIAYTLTTFPVVPLSVVLKDALVTMGTTLSINPKGDSGGGIITGANISIATINYLSGFISGSLVTTPQGSITADYYHYTQYLVESELSSSLLGDNISDLILAVREALHDTSFTSPAFTDDELIRKIKEATRRFTGSEGTVLIEEYKISVIILLVRASCCFDLAYDTSRYYHLELPDGIKMFRGEIPEHYMKLATALEKQYKQLTEDLGEEDGTVMGTPVMEVIQNTRHSYFNSVRNKYEY